jgi:hypothetical protein
LCPTRCCCQLPTSAGGGSPESLSPPAAPGRSSRNIAPN